jgi:nitroreductase
MPDETANLFDIMATTRSMRRLKSDPVPPELIRKILEAGVSAPSGGTVNTLAPAAEEGRSKLRKAASRRYILTSAAWSNQTDNYLLVMVCRAV